MRTALIILMVVMALAGVILLARWVYLDAKSRGVNPLPWVLLVLFVSPNFIGLIIYALVRPKNRADTCASCGAGIPGDSRYCQYCGAPQERKQISAPQGGPGLKPLIAGAALLLATIIVAAALIVKTVSGGITPFGGYTLGSVSNKWGNSWSMSFHTFQGTQSAAFTADSDSPQLTYSSEVTQGEMNIRVFDKDNAIVADLPANDSGVLTGLTKGMKYKVAVTAEQARGKFAFKME